MKIFKLILIAVLMFSALGCKYKGTLDDYRNFYAVVWRGDALDNVKYAQQMGYSHIANHGKMRYMPESEGLRFYIVNPEVTTAVLDRRIDSTKAYTQAEAAAYESILPWKNNGLKFPHNVATGWFFNDRESLMVYDYQQQAVIDLVIDRAIASAHALENPDIDYMFAGIMWDVQDLRGDFWTGVGKDGGKFAQLSHWNGVDSCAATSHIHEHATYRDGKAAYYKQLYARVREDFPDAKFVGEPFLIYQRWIKELSERPDGLEIMPDMLMQEANGVEFADARNFESGLISMDRVGSTTPRAYSIEDNLRIASTAAVNGAWFNWFGKFGGDGDMPNYQSIRDVPARLKLIRMIPAWDNLWGIPLKIRQAFDGEKYASITSYADASVIYSRQPVTGKIFAVFLGGSGSVELHKGQVLDTVMRTDGLFIETVSGMADIEYSDNTITLLDQSKIGDGYIITSRDK